MGTMLQVSLQMAVVNSKRHHAFFVWSKTVKTKRFSEAHHQSHLVDGKKCQYPFIEVFQII